MRKLTAFILALVCVFILLAKTRPVFETDQISRITFYAYSGSGKGSDVPAEDMAEIIDWLDSFRIRKIAFGLLPPGTNTVCVEIEYSDGRIIKCGLDAVEIVGIMFYTNCDQAPECFWEILNETSLRD